MTDEKLIEQQYDQYEAAPEILEHYHNMDQNITIQKIGVICSAK